MKPFLKQILIFLGMATRGHKKQQMTALVIMMPMPMFVISHNVDKLR